MERRIALKLMAAGVIAPAAYGSRAGLVGIAPAQAAAVGYAPEFFTSAEMAALDRLTEILIPADERSGGASAAHVDRYIDVMAAAGSAEAGGRWKAGLVAGDEAAQGIFGDAFTSGSPPQQEAVVALLALHEGSPPSDLERFFALLKKTTIDGYYTSRVGIHDEMKYQGNTALAEFPGCTHPEHQA